MDSIRISDSLFALSGEGLEYYVKGDTVLAKFFNGNIVNLSKDIPIEDSTIPAQDNSIVASE